MNREHISAALRLFVTERAEHRCEYCLLHEDDSALAFSLDHIIALRHAGATDADNLALACPPCNRNKGTDLTAFDPQTGTIARLFHPREQRWVEHFFLDGPYIIGRTETGRATVAFLRFNQIDRIIEREMLISIGRYPDFA